MRLVDLDPHWISFDGRHGQGVRFDCPAHKGSHSIAVFFENPVDGKAKVGPDRTPTPRWIREGDTFETLTIKPSINAKANDPTCWHGYVIDGRITFE